MHRLTRLLPFSFALVLVLAACGPNTDSPAATTDDGGEQPPPAGSEAPAASGDGAAGGMEASGDIFVYGFSYESTDDIVARTRVEFAREQYADLDISFSETEFESAGFLTALQGDEPPDVVRISRDIYGTYIAAGRLMPLDECVSSAGVDTSIYREPAMEQLTADGTLYGLPDFYDVAIWMAAPRSGRRTASTSRASTGATGMRSPKRTISCGPVRAVTCRRSGSTPRSRATTPSSTSGSRPTVVSC